MSGIFLLLLYFFKVLSCPDINKKTIAQTAAANLGQKNLSPLHLCVYLHIQQTPFQACTSLSKFSRVISELIKAVVLACRVLLYPAPFQYLLCVTFWKKMGELARLPFRKKCLITCTQLLQTINLGMMMADIRGGTSASSQFLMHLTVFHM